MADTKLKSSSSSVPTLVPYERFGALTDAEKYKLYSDTVLGALILKARAKKTSAKKRAAEAPAETTSKATPTAKKATKATPT